jgi:hypothetical protein
MDPTSFTRWKNTRKGHDMSSIHPNQIEPALDSIRTRQIHRQLSILHFTPKHIHVQNFDLLQNVQRGTKTEVTLKKFLWQIIHIK